MNETYKDWRTCDLCGSEGMCRPASEKEVTLYDAEDVCQRCDSEEMNTWISVKDRLPEETQAYGGYTDDVLCTNGHSVFVAFLARTSGYPTWYCGDSHMHVTHWMPLPSMPE